jgi:hypothetical protein
MPSKLAKFRVWTPSRLFYIKIFKLKKMYCPSISNVDKHFATKQKKNCIKIGLKIKKLKI